MDSLPDILLREFLESPSGKKLEQIMETIATVQRRLFEISESSDSRQLDLLKIGTVFQVFLIDCLASGKTPQSMSNKDWKAIAEKVFQYAVFADGQSYSVFVFVLYADYIDLSADVFKGRIEEPRLQSIRNLAGDIRLNAAKLNTGEISEVRYTEDCMWLSLEAMVKLLSSWLAGKIISKDCAEFAQLAEAVSDLGFEYGRYVLYAKENALLEAYIQGQYVLDEQLQSQYETFLSELQEQSNQFQALIEKAFAPDIRDSLMQSAALAQAAGVREEEILTSMEDIDEFFMD